jgi:hypothetical protein
LLPVLLAAYTTMSSVTLKQCHGLAPEIVHAIIALLGEEDLSRLFYVSREFKVRPFHESVGLESKKITSIL